ncbi:hypothetical protein U1Q18_013271 [Sarracenia purpurea var. burkii]
MERHLFGTLVAGMQTGEITLRVALETSPGNISSVSSGHLHHPRSSAPTASALRTAVPPPLAPPPPPLPPPPPPLPPIWNMLRYNGAG